MGIYDVPIRLVYEGSVRVIANSKREAEMKAEHAPWAQGELVKELVDWTREGPAQEEGYE